MGGCRIGHFCLSGQNSSCRPIAELPRELGNGLLGAQDGNEQSGLHLVSVTQEPTSYVLPRAWFSGCTVLSISLTWLLGDWPSPSSHSLVKQGKDISNENTHLEEETRGCHWVLMTKSCWVGKVLLGGHGEDP